LPQRAAFNEEVRALLTGSIAPQALARELEMFELKAASSQWGASIRSAILPGHELIQGQRQYFRFAALRHDWRKRLPAGFHLDFVTADLLARQDLANLDALREELCSERPSVDDFLARSFGLVAICDADAALAGWCTSEYNSGAACEVGIGTLEPYQRRGLATAMGSAFVEQALSRGVTQIGWHCWARNLPSVATALAIGYEKVCDYTTLIVRFDHEDDPEAKAQQIAVHELTHAWTAHLMLPAWLNEGLAMVTTERFAAKPMVRQDSLALLEQHGEREGSLSKQAARPGGMDEVIALYARGYWRTRYLEEMQPGLLRDVLAQPQPRDWEGAIAAACQADVQSFWPALDVALAAHFD
jgi:GNAT superfamily N-acetyltransferase